MIFSRFVLFILLSLFIFNSCSSDNDTAPIENSVPADNSDSGDDSDSTDSSEIILTNPIVQEITDISATLISSYSTSSELPVQSIGFCWSTNPSPTIDDNTIEVSIDDTNFSATISNLESRTTYYVRTFATNTAGVYYSSDNSFETEISPEIVYDGDLSLLNQDEVDAFLDTGYEIVTGSLFVKTESLPEINDLTPLQNLTTVGGSFEIRNNTKLLDVSGLERLEEVGSLVIIENTNLNSVASLTQLHSIASNLRIIESPIESVQAFENITIIPDLLVLRETNVTDLSGFENLTEVGELALLSNLQLQNIHALLSLHTVYRRLYFFNNTALENFTGLNGLTTLNLNDGKGDFTISFHTSLTDLKGLENITQFNGLINIHDNVNLESIEQLSSIIEMDYLFMIRNNTSLSNFCPLRPLFSSDKTVGLIAEGNAYNPTKQDIIDGNCSF